MLFLEQNFYFQNNSSYINVKQRFSGFSQDVKGFWKSCCTNMREYLNFVFRLKKTKQNKLEKIENTKRHFNEKSFINYCLLFKP